MTLASRAAGLVASAALAAGAAALGLAAAAGAGQPRPEAPRLGFTAASLARQLRLEAAFRAGVAADQIAAFHRDVTVRPHMAGTEGGAATAAYLARALRDAGLEVEVHEYLAWLSLPRDVQVEIVEPDRVPLSVVEPASDADPATRHPDLPIGFVAYSASGEVEAPAVYVNYGLPEDYAQLAATGVTARGRIAVARYGRSHRAVKVHTAQEQGAAGLILYSDPADDGFVRGEEAPAGFWRGRDMLQRGNAKLSWHWHGDPLTPGVAALPGAPRLDPAAVPTLPRIPVAVLSWGEARKILERLDGPAAPAGFQGGLPFTYRAGGSLAVRLAVRMDDGLRSIRNVIARVPGRGAQVVLLGTHHDAWTFGGVDPGSAVAVLLEVARGLGTRRREGWRPERSIAIAFWDAEEFGLIGSTEHAERFHDELRAHAVAYINTDMYYRGRLDAGGAPSLRAFLVEVARDVADEAGSVYDAWRESEWTRQPAERQREGRAGFDVELRALGSGADFVPFQVFLGLPTLSIELIGEAGYGFGTYHSIYDTRAYFERHGDPGFRRGAVLARLLGTAALRLAEADVLPFRYSEYAGRIAAALEAVPSWEVGREGRERLPIDVTPLAALAWRAAGRAAALEREIDAALAAGRLDAGVRVAINARLPQLEQRLLLDERASAADRWFRHVVHGWNIYALYDGQPFPGLAEAARLGDPARRDAEIAALRAALARLLAGLDEIAVLVRAP